MEELLMAIKRKMEDFKFEADKAVTKGNQEAGCGPGRRRLKSINS